MLFYHINARKELNALICLANTHDDVYTVVKIVDPENKLRHLQVGKELVLRDPTRYLAPYISKILKSRPSL